MKHKTGFVQLNTREIKFSFVEVVDALDSV